MLYVYMLVLSDVACVYMLYVIVYMCMMYAGASSEASAGACARDGAVKTCARVG